MHCSHAEDGAQVFVELGTLIVEGRLPAQGTARGYHEGPHCPAPPTTAPTASIHHICDPDHFLCTRWERLRKHLSLLCSAAVPMCVEVLLCPACPCGAQRARTPDVASIPSPSDILLEQWTVSVVRVSAEPCSMSVRGLFQAVRSQLHFSQLSAWWSSSRGSRPANVCYRVTLPEQEFASQFAKPPLLHTFPPASVGPDTQLKVSVRTLPRSESLPAVQCAACTPQTSVRKRSIGLDQPMLGESLLDPPGPPGPTINRAHAGMCKWHTASPPSPPRRRASRQHKPAHPALHILPLPGPVDDRMQTDCDLHGKHDCRCEEEVEEMPSQKQKHSEPASNKINLDHIEAASNKIILDHSEATSNKINLDLSQKEMAEVLTVLRSRVEVPESIPALDKDKDSAKDSAKGDLLLSAILRSCRPSLNLEAKKLSPPHDNGLIRSIVDRIRTKQCDLSYNSNKCQEEFEEYEFIEDFNNLDLNKRVEMEPPSGRDVPSALDKAKFRRSLDSAASMVFHWRTGLPLTSSPAPLRRASPASHRFDFDSSLNSVSAIRSALFDAESGEGEGEGEDTESEGSSKSPCSPQIDIPDGRDPWTVHYQCPASALLGSFEESVLNGRLEPVSTVHGFTADLGASGSFCPPHLTLPVTVFFYTLGDNDKVSTPYLAHINLGKKGYTVPRSGTIQVTLLNPLGTVIKMFVVVYDLTDMPANSHTFLRQRTLYMPSALAEPSDNSQKYLRYLIHLRFASSKSGRVSLHTDIRIIIFRKLDVETAAGHGVAVDGAGVAACELRSFTHGPTNPKFSPRK